MFTNKSGQKGRERYGKHHFESIKYFKKMVDMDLFINLLTA